MGLNMVNSFCVKHAGGVPSELVWEPPWEDWLPGRLRSALLSGISGVPSGRLAVPSGRSEVWVTPLGGLGYPVSSWGLNKSFRTKEEP